MKTPAQVEEHLSGAYRRIMRTAIALSLIAIAPIGIFLNWTASLGLAFGACVIILNFAWLHYGTETLVNRIVTDKNSPARFRLMFPFPLRYLLTIGAAYVIVKSYPRMLIGFIVGLALPILAAMGEGVYEAVTISKTHQASD
jgi:hypothetical protein